MPRRPDTQSSRQAQQARHRSHFLKQGFGCLLTLCVAVAGFLVGAFAAGLLFYALQQAIPTVSWYTFVALPIIGLGFCCLFSANPLLVHLCYRLKRRYLRRHGLTAEATVIHQEWTSLFNPKGPSGDLFDLMLRWQHPETGQTCEYICTYIFIFGLSRKQRQQFFSDYRSGAHLPVLFSPKHPRYFVVDIPFVPTWFDVLF
ncbi:MAG TPA: hypothetical protein VFB60_24240 [Ktedonobacteraceae bacterium]|nr:hypothetical protein [Ktedonobacteraceae bacterium]